MKTISSSSFSLPSEQALSLVGDLPTHGYLAATSRGLLYLDLDDTWIFNLQEELGRFDQDILEPCLDSEGENVTLCKKVWLPAASLLLPSCTPWLASQSTCN